MKDSLDAIFEIFKLVGCSPKHDSRFEKLKQELALMHSPGLRVLSFKRWSVRAESSKTVLDNYTVLLTLWHDLTWPEMRLWRIGDLKFEKFSVGACPKTPQERA